MTHDDENHGKSIENRRTGKESSQPLTDPVYKVVGTNPARHDAPEKVTGKAQFGADIHLPGMLYGAVLRSPHAHARIISIDTSRVFELDGVKAVITSDDLPDVDPGENQWRYFNSANILAHDKVLYHGHALAAVAAIDPHTAGEALKLIRVEYELLPPVLDVRQAMKPDSPILLDFLRTNELGSKIDRASNVAEHFRVEMGNYETGFSEADIIIEREFVTSMVHQGYIEPQSATATWLPDGQVTIWCTSQGAFDVRDQVASILNIPYSHILVNPMEIGGGFGGKNRVYLEPLAVLLSRKSGGRPVKLTMSRAEVLLATGPTSGSVIQVKIGAKKDGTLVAAQATLIYEAGAFPGAPVGSGAGIMFAPYRFENVQIDCFDVVVNKPWVSSYRAPGGTNANFAAESVIDELCQSLGMDPLEFRLLNGVQEGDQHLHGFRYGPIGLMKDIQAAREHPHYPSPIREMPGRRVGRGVACSFWGNYGGKSSASASLHSDGSVNLITGSVDLSGTRMSLAMQLAETLNIPFEMIRSQVASTDYVGFTEGSYGSRTTFATGLAVIEVGKKLIEEMKQRVARLWEVEPAEIIYAGGEFSVPGNSSRNGAKVIPIKELASRLDETGGPVVASAAVLPDTAAPVFAVHLADVAIDPETGKVDLLRYTAVTDVGKAVYPDYVEGQIQGGVTQGIGWGLNEAFLYNSEGHLTNASLLDYRMPTSLDLPFIDTVLIEVANPGHPYGVRGVGEIPILAPPAAIANAIANATGVRLTDLPMSPERILEVLSS